MNSYEAYIRVKFHTMPDLLARFLENFGPLRERVRILCRVGDSVRISYLDSCFRLKKLCFDIRTKDLDYFDYKTLVFRSFLGGFHLSRCPHGRLVGEYCSSIFEADLKREASPGTGGNVPGSALGSPCLLARNLRSITVHKLQCWTCLNEAPLRSQRRLTECQYLRYLKSPGRSLPLELYVDNFMLPVAVPGLQAGDAPIQHDEGVEEVYVPPPVIPLVLLDGDTDLEGEDDYPLSTTVLRSGVEVVNIF